MGKVRDTAIPSVKHPYALRSFHSASTTHRSKGQRRSATVRTTGPVTGSQSKRVNAACATGKFGHASTQDSPDSDEDEDGIDLNIPCAIIDLDEPGNRSARKTKPQSKGKRRASLLQSSCSSKRSSPGDELEIQKMSGELSEMWIHFDRMQTNLGKGPSNAATSSRPSDPILDAMALLNDLAAEHDISEENYWKVAYSFSGINKAKIFANMEPNRRLEWLTQGI